MGWCTLPTATDRHSPATVLDPIDRVSEVLFGLIMVLTFTGSLSVANPERSEVREMLVDVEHPGCETPVKQTGVPIKMTETPGRIRQRAAILGEHTDQIMAEVGYKETEIAALKRDKVVG